jgi:hypothetical protein
LRLSGARWPLVLANGTAASRVGGAACDGILAALRAGGDVDDTASAIFCRVNKLSLGSLVVNATVAVFMSNRHDPIALPRVLRNASTRLRGNFQANRVAHEYRSAVSGGGGGGGDDAIGDAVGVMDASAVITRVSGPSAVAAPRTTKDQRAAGNGGAGVACADRCRLTIIASTCGVLFIGAVAAAGFTLIRDTDERATSRKRKQGKKGGDDGADAVTGVRGAPNAAELELRNPLSMPSVALNIEQATPPTSAEAAARAELVTQVRGRLPPVPATTAPRTPAPGGVLRDRDGIGPHRRRRRTPSASSMSSVDTGFAIATAGQ